MLTYDAAIGAADKAAGTVWRAAQGPQSFGWRDGLVVRSVRVLAEFVDANRIASAPALYSFATGSGAAVPPFHQVPPALRVAIEVFRATFLVLLEELEKAAAVAVLLPPVEPAAARSLVAPSVAQCQPARGHMTAPVSAVPVSTARMPCGHPKGPLEDNIRRLEESWDRDSGRPAKRQRKEIAR